MKHCYRLFALLLLLAVSAFAQNSRHDGIVQARSGFPAPGVLVAVCIQPCAVPANVSISNPPATLAPLCSSFTDAICTSPNPVTADGLGNYNFYVKPGRYTLVFYGSGFGARTQTDQIMPCDPNNCAFPGNIVLQSASVVCWNADFGITRQAAAEFNMGTCTPGDKSGKLNLTTVNAATGYQIGGTATTNQALIGNGTNFVSTALTLASAQFANQGSTNYGSTRERSG